MNIFLYYIFLVHATQDGDWQVRGQCYPFFFITPPSRMLRGVFSSHSQPIRTRLGKPRIRLCFVLFLFFQNTVLKIFLVICQKTPHYDQTFLGFVFILKGGKEEDALLQELYAQAAEEYYETMKKSLVQISLKTPQVRGLENEDAELRRLGPSPPVKGVVFFS